MNIPSFEKVRAAVQRLPLTRLEERAFWRTPDSKVFGLFQDEVVGSRFLAVQDLDTATVVGHVASIVNQEDLPLKLRFDDLDSDTFIASDRLLRAMHTLNYFGGELQPQRLFLDVNQRFFTSVVDNHGKAFRLVLESLGLQASDFVIQVQSNANTDFGTFAFVADNYRRNGFMTGLYTTSPGEALSFLTQIRPDFLSVCWGAAWTLDDIGRLSELARQHHVRLVIDAAEGVHDQLRLFDGLLIR